MLCSPFGVGEGEHKAFLSCALKTGTDGAAAQANGLIDGHAYTLLSVIEVGNSGDSGHYRLLELRNPWGEFEWTGNFSDHSDKWNANLKELCDFSSEADGTFWMAWQDFLRFFDEVEVGGFSSPARVGRLLHAVRYFAGRDISACIARDIHSYNRFTFI